jgi:hypothetical protein
MFFEAHLARLLATLTQCKPKLQVTTRHDFTALTTQGKLAALLLASLTFVTTLEST